MSGAVDQGSSAESPPGWERLDAAAELALLALESWQARVREAEAEVVQLRDALEAAIDAGPVEADAREQMRRLRAENAALRSRMSQAQRRISALLGWTDALAEEP